VCRFKLKAVFGMGYSKVYVKVSLIPVTFHGGLVDKLITVQIMQLKLKNNTHEHPEY